MKKNIIGLLIIAISLFYLAPLAKAQENTQEKPAGQKVWVLRTEAYPGKTLIIWSDGSVSEEIVGGGGEVVEIVPPQPPGPPVPGPEVPAWLRKLGNIFLETAGMIFYDSGAMVSKLSELKWIPDKVAGTVKAFLASGIGAETSKDGSAIITLLDGTEKKIANIRGGYQALKSDWGWSADGKAYKSDYAYAGYGQLWEGQYKTDYTTKESRSTANSYYYNYAGSSYGKYSGVSLDTRYGYAYESSHYDLEPFKSTYSYDKQSDGSYSGSSSGYYNRSSTGNGGYNYPQYNYLNGSTSTNTYKSGYDSNYNYNAKTGTYTSSSKGSYDYSYSVDVAKGNDYNYGNAYTYSSDSTYNYNTRSSSSTSRYDYKNGTSYTYNYQSTPSASTGGYSYSYTVTDNKTGKVIYKYP